MGVFAVKYNDATYFYKKNAQNDIIALLDNNGAIVVKYKYDAWGNCKILSADGFEITDNNHIGILNPFRYRSYKITPYIFGSEISLSLEKIMARSFHNAIIKSKTN